VHEEALERLGMAIQPNVTEVEPAPERSPPKCVEEEGGEEILSAFSG